jgi:hypothetical protein
MTLRAVLAAAALALTAAPAVASPSAPAPGPNAVVAVIDTGIDPYHPAFRDPSPRARRHPSTYLPGYPRDAIALRLGKSPKADCDRVWRKVRPGRLYWFPGTRIVGARSFDLTKTVGSCDNAPVYDTHGHGTMTASRAVGAPYGACPACLVVSLQFQVGYGVINAKQAEVSAVGAVTWAGANASWIDAQSNSWGPLPAYDPTGEGGLFFEGKALTRAAEDTARRHLAFWSAGNGVAHAFGVVGWPTTATAHFGPSVIRVGGQDSGYVTAWSGLTPHVVADACDNWAAEAGTGRSGPRVGGGTSSAAPYVAGGAIAALRYARQLTGDVRTGVRDGVVARGRRTPGGPLSDGVLTLAEWRDVALKTASTRPAAQPDDGPACPATDPLFAPLPVRWADVPAGVPEYALVGYGAVDEAAVARARAVLDGRAALPDRSGADTFFAADGLARETLHQAYRGI